MRTHQLHRDRVANNIELNFLCRSMPYAAQAEEQTKSAKDGFMSNHLLMVESIQLHLTKHNFVTQSKTILYLAQSVTGYFNEFQRSLLIKIQSY